jgi:hypothetical protein
MIAITLAVGLTAMPASGQTPLHVRFQLAPGSPLPAGPGPVGLARTAPVSSDTLGLVVTNPDAGTVSLFLGDGRGLLTPAPGSPGLTGGSSPSSVFTEGGISTYLPPTGLVTSPSHQTDLGTLYGTLDRPFGVPSGAALLGAIVIANAGTNNVSVISVDETNHLSLIPGSPFAAGGQRPIAALPIGISPAPPALAVINAASADVSVLVDNGKGGYGPGPTPPVPTGLSRPVAAAIGDFNGDGNVDLAIVGEDSGTGRNVAVLLGDGHGRFTPAPGSPFSSGGARPDAVLVRDFNDDGKADLAIANGSSDTISVLLGNGDGTFALAPGSPFPSGGHGPSALAGADFTGDGKEDIAVANQASGSLGLFVGDGTGRFVQPSGFPIPTGGDLPAGVLAADFNGDGEEDLAVANSGSGTISVLLNTTTAPSLPLLRQPRLRSNGQVTITARAPSSGFFEAEATFKAPSGQPALYGCGEASARSAGRQASITLYPTPTGLGTFRKSHSLELFVHVGFLRRDEALIAQGGSVHTTRVIRHAAGRRRRPRVIVHVTRNQRSTITQGSRQSTADRSPASSAQAQSVHCDFGPRS